MNLSGMEWFYYSQNDLSTPVEGDEDMPLPEEITVKAYPNPFNSTTTLNISGAYNAEIEIYDIAGRYITSLQAIGGRATWNASGLSSGVYFARANFENANIIKLVYLK